MSNLLQSSFNYETGPWQDYDFETPAKRYLIKGDWNLNAANKITFRYTQLDSNTDVLMINSSSLGFGNRQRQPVLDELRQLQLPQHENIKSGIGEWNTIIGSNMSNSLIVGYNYSDESREVRGTFFPMVDILDGNSTTYMAFGFEPFTPNNELRYSSFQLQNNFTQFSNKHTLTFGGTFERYESENVFFPGSQSVYVYNTLDDFLADAAGYLANPNRTTSTVNLRRFQVRYNNIPGQEKPIQPLEVLYAGAYAQDEWSVSDNLKLTLGLRFDVPVFGDTGYANAEADALTFRDENGQPVQYETAKLPDANILWSPRAGFNWNADAERRTQVRGGTGIFTGRPAYVWISNQIGNTGVLTGFDQLDQAATAPLFSRPFSPDPNRYKPTNVTGAPAATYELALTNADFMFPQVWRSNIAVDRRLPWGITGTAEYIYYEGRERRVLHQREPARGPDQLLGGGHPPALYEQPHPLEHRQRRGPQEPGRRRFVEPRVLRQQELQGRLRQVRIQLRRGQEYGGRWLDRLRIVEQQPASRRPEQPGSGIWQRVARPPLLPGRLLHQGVLRLRWHDVLGLL